MDVLTDLERLDPIWLKIEAFLKERKEKWIRSLVAKENEEFRGRIKELEFLITPPAATHTAHSHPRTRADEEDTWAH